jgi:hypothetical protein
MRKAKLIAAASLLVSLATAGVAHADSTVITGTGAGSTNSANITNTYVETVVNTDTVVANNVNGQGGNTGNGQVNGNTTGGDAVSGSVNNSNSFVTTVAISNIGGQGGSSTTVVPSSTEETTVAQLPRTGGGLVDMRLLDALMRARQGVLSQAPMSLPQWSWGMTALAAAVALGSTYGYGRLMSRRINKLAATV